MKWYEKQKHIYTTNYEQDKQADASMSETADSASDDETASAAFDDFTDQSIMPATAEVKESCQKADTSADNEKTVIGKGAVINGDMECAGDLQFHGSIRGNIICHGYLEVTDAEVTGNITCGHLLVEDTVMNGNVACDREMSVHQNAVINGDIQTYDIDNSGQIVGTVTAEHYVHVLSSGSINGDVITEDIEIARGANLQGTITMNQ